MKEEEVTSYNQSRLISILLKNPSPCNNTPWNMYISAGRGAEISMWQYSAVVFMWSNG
jgi:hypothetical protein